MLKLCVCGLFVERSCFLCWVDRLRKREKRNKHRDQEKVIEEPSRASKKMMSKTLAATRERVCDEEKKNVASGGLFGDVWMFGDVGGMGCVGLRWNFRGMQGERRLCGGAGV